MKVTVKLLAGLREKAQTSEMTVESSRTLSCGDVLLRLEDRFPETSPLVHHCLIARNGRFVHEDSELMNGDEMAVLPPFSGG